MDPKHLFVDERLKGSCVSGDRLSEAVEMDGVVLCDKQTDKCAGAQSRTPQDAEFLKQFAW